VRERLVRVVDDPQSIADANAVMDAYEAVAATEADRALVHTDVGLHNLAIDPASHVVHGIFDYDGAAWADRHHDFRYLMFALDRYELLEAAIAAYEGIAAHRIARPCSAYNAACAVSYLAFRAGTEPEERSCGSASTLVPFRVVFFRNFAWTTRPTRSPWPGLPQRGTLGPWTPSSVSPTTLP
jgi:hypothetical protein